MVNYIDIIGRFVENCLANSVHPDQTAPWELLGSSLTRVYTVYSDISVSVFRVNIKKATV